MKKPTKYVATAILATMMLVAFSATPALATTTNLPPYSTWADFIGGTGSANASPSFGNEWVYSQNDPIHGHLGNTDVVLISSAISLTNGQKITLSSTSATIDGILYVDPVGGTSAWIKVLSYVSLNSNCSTQDSTSNIQLLNKQITSSSWSTNTGYSSSGTTSYTASGGKTVYVCGYAEADSTGGYTYSDFGSSGSGYKITNFKITATY